MAGWRRGWLFAVGAVWLAVACGDDDGPGGLDAAVERDAEAPRDGHTSDDMPDPIDFGEVDCDQDDDGSEGPRCGGDDCADLDPDIYPGAPDTVGDSVDQNCDGRDGVDADGDGFASVESGGEDCDDGDVSIHPGARDNPWVEEFIVRDGLSTTSRSISTAIGDDGTFHIAYALRDRVSYAVGTLGAWTSELVEEFDPDALPTSGGAFTNLALAPDGTVHIVYTGATGARHAVRGAGGWTLETITGAQVTHQAAVMDIDTSGAIHLVFEVDTEPADFGYATNDTGAWVVEIVSTPNDDGVEAALVVDASGTPHVSHYGRDTLEMRHAWREGGAWMSELIALTSNTSGRVSMSTLALDSSGGLHTVYRSNRIPSYRRREGGAWSAPTRLGDTGAGVFPVMTVSSTGIVHVVHTESLSGTFDHRMIVATDESGSWARENLGVTAQWAATALELDADGNPYIFFAHDDRDDLAVMYRLRDGIDQDCSGDDG